MKVQSIQPTPNPNAFKFLMDHPLVGGTDTLSYSKPEDARDDVIGQALFAVPGIETVFFCENFVTVSMTAEADWRTVAEQVTKVLESHDAPTVAAKATSPEKAAKPAGQAPVGDDAEMLGRINDLLDDRVRPALAGDGGGLEVMGLEGKTLTISYQGACGSCPSSTAGTLMAIQNLLQSEVDDELVVTLA